MEKVILKGETEKDLEILFRYPTKNDLEIMHKFINTISAERTYIRTQGVVITLDQEKSYLDNQLKKINDHHSMQLLAFHNKELVGISGVEMKDKAQKHIGNFGISVAKKFRGKKIGSKLMKVVLEESTKSLTDLRLIALTVFANNPVAYEMYKKFGFIEYGRLPKGLTYRDKFVDEIYMYKNVAK